MILKRLRESNPDRRVVCVLIGFVAAFTWLAPMAQAAYIGTDLVQITLSNSQGKSASVRIANPFDTIPPPANVPDRVVQGMTGHYELKDGTDTLGWVDSLGVTLEGDPVASINFALTAGGSDVTVTVSSATVTFPSLLNPPASAEAEITLTDNGGAAAMISITGGNSGLFKALYNGPTVYTSLLGTTSVGGGSITFDQDTSGPIAGSVSSIQAQFAFQLSAGDSASGTGTFTVVPEPASAVFALGACVALIASRRRR